MEERDDCRPSDATDPGAAHALEPLFGASHSGSPVAAYGAAVASPGPFDALRLLPVWRPADASRAAVCPRGAGAAERGRVGAGDLAVLRHELRAGRRARAPCPAPPRLPPP